MNFEWRLRWVAMGVVAVYWGAMFAGTHFDIDFSGPEIPSVPGDKVMHFVAYAGLAFLWLVAAACFGRVTWVMYLLVMAGAALYGAVDEISQSMVGRDMDIADWRFDVMGAAIGSIAFACLYAGWNLWQGSREADARVEHQGNETQRQPQMMTDAEYLDWFNGEFWRTLHGPGVGSLSRLQRDALCVLNFQAELNNGGMHQYLLNSSGDFAKETPDVFRRIGAADAASMLEEANAFFGAGGPPLDREARMTALLALPKCAEDRIHALSGEFYGAEDRGLSLADLFDAYVLAQRGEGSG